MVSWFVCLLKIRRTNLKTILGKLKAFSGSSMNQMKNIRDQQERLSKLHFDLNMMSTTSSNDSKNDQMAQLVQKLNEISHSIEKLNSNSDPWCNFMKNKNVLFNEKFKDLFCLVMATIFANNFSFYLYYKLFFGFLESSGFLAKTITNFS